MNARTTSVYNMAKSILKKLGQEETGFDDWPLDELVDRLEQDGVEVPLDANPHDLCAFATEFYNLKNVTPSRLYAGASEVMRGNDGTIYLEKPKSENATTKSGKIRRDPSRQHDPYLHMDGETYEDDFDQHKSLLIDKNVEHDSDLSNNEAEEGDGEVKKQESIHELGQELQGFTDIMAEGGDARVKKEFKRPNLKLAKAYADMNHPRDENGNRYHWFKVKTGRHCFGSKGLWRLFDPLQEGTNSEFAKYGVGVSLYFKFLKWLYWTFCFIGLITLPQCVIDYNSGRARFSLDSTSIGHLAKVAFFFNGTKITGTGVQPGILNQTGLVTLGFDDNDILVPYVSCGGQACFYSRADLGKLYSALDIIAIALFTLSLRWLMYFEKNESTQITKHHLTVEEYAIHVVRIPHDCTEETLKNHFEGLTGGKVADVSLVQDNGQLLELYVARGKIINQLWKAAAKVYLLRQDHRAAPNKHVITNERLLNARIKDAVREYDRIYARLLNINEQRNRLKAGRKSLGAFVIFETQKAFLKCLDFYALHSVVHRRQPLALRLDPKKYLKVRQAPPPSTIIWENTHYSWGARRRRRWLTTVGTGIALSASLLANFFAERARKDISSRIYSTTCDLISYNPLTSVLITHPSYGQISGNLTALTIIFSDIQNNRPVAIELYRQYTQVEACYCQSLSYSEAALAVIDVADRCHDYWGGKAPLYVYTFFATAVIGAVNIILQYLFMWFGQFEKHHSIVNMQLSIQRRVFVALFLNTGFILLAVNAAVPGSASEVWHGKFGDFSPDWYGSVGFQLTLVMIFNIFSPHFFPLTSFYLHHQRIRTVVAYSQRELNEAYLGPQFTLSFRVAQVTMTVFVVFLYGAGMPILYWIACCTFMVEFYLDKYLLCNFYQIPPAYNDRLLNWSTSNLSWAVIGHLCFAVWMLSAEGIFWDGKSIGSSSATALGSSFGLKVSEEDLAKGSGGLRFAQRMTLDHIIPLYILLVVMIAIKVAGFLFRGLDSIRSVCCRTATCGVFDDGRVKRKYLNDDYSLALDNDEIRGLVNYNILQNPKYMRALGITKEFATNHRHLHSVEDLAAADLPELTQSTKSFHPAVRNSEGRKSKPDEVRKSNEVRKSKPDEKARKSRKAEAEEQERQIVAARANQVGDDEDVEFEISREEALKQEEARREREKKDNRRSAGFNDIVTKTVEQEIKVKERLSQTRPETSKEGDGNAKRNSIAQAFAHRGMVDDAL